MRDSFFTYDADGGKSAVGVDLPFLNEFGRIVRNHEMARPIRNAHRPYRLKT